MAGKTGRWFAALVLVAGLVTPARVRAGLIFGPRRGQDPDCPAGSYSPLHYWAPSLYTLRAQHHGSTAAMYAPVRYPHVPISYRITTFACPAINPAAPPYGGDHTPR
jgi:hypothetical protein